MHIFFFKNSNTESQMLKCLKQNIKDKINIHLKNILIYIINLVSIKVNLNNNKYRYYLDNNNFNLNQIYIQFIDYQNGYKGRGEYLKCKLK